MQERHGDVGEIGEAAITGGKLFAWGEHRGEADQASVTAVASERIPEQIPLHQIFVGDDAAALLKPVVHQLASLALLNQHAIALLCLAGHLLAVLRACDDINYFPAAPRYARAGRMD